MSSFSKQQINRLLALQSLGSQGGGGSGLIVDPTQPLSTITNRMDLVANYGFGSATPASQGLTAIRNATDLSTYFRYYQDAGGGLPIPLINSQMERYQPFTSAQNFVFAPDSLQLTATLDPGGSVNIQGAVTPSGGIHTNGGTNLFSNYPTVTPSAITIGQLVCVQFAGLYYVTNVTGTTSFTISPVPNYGSSISDQFNKSVTFLNAYYASLSSPYNTGDLTLHFASVPAGVTNGMAVSCDSAANGSMFWGGQSYVTGTTSTTVTIDVPNGNGSFNGSVFFTPPIRSGQFWTQQYYGVGFNDVQAVAMQIDCLLPGNGSATRFTNINPASLNPAAPYGAWSAFWTYSGNSGGAWSDNSEIDVVEVVNSSTVDSTVFTGLQRGIDASVAFLRNTAGGTWQSNNTLNFRNVDLSLARHQFALLWLPSRTYRYLDGEILSGDTFIWGSGDEAQVGVDVSAGSLSKSNAANLQFPYNNACFPYAFTVYGIKIWQL